MKVGPDFTSLNQANEAAGYVVFCGYDSLRSVIAANADYFTSRQLCATMRLASGGFAQPSPVSHVFKSCPPIEVGRNVIGFVAIAVAHFLIWIANPLECGCHKAMNVVAGLLVGLGKLDSLISVWPRIRRNGLGSQNPVTISAVFNNTPFGSHPSKVRNFIFGLISDNIPPTLHHDGQLAYGVRHDKHLPWRDYP